MLRSMSLVVTKSAVSNFCHANCLVARIWQRLRLRRSGGVGQTGVHHHAIAVLRRQGATKSQLRTLAIGLACQAGVGICGRGVGFVRALLFGKLRLAVVPGGRWFVVAVLATEALHAGPGLNQRAVNREMVVRQQRPDLRSESRPCVAKVMPLVLPTPKRRAAAASVIRTVGASDVDDPTAAAY
jgi:hypothetical protein